MGIPDTHHEGVSTTCSIICTRMPFCYSELKMTPSVCKNLDLMLPMKQDMTLIWLWLSQTTYIWWDLLEKHVWWWCRKSQGS